MPYPFVPSDFTGTFWTIQDGKYYVSTIGNDVTGDGSPQNPFLTIHRVFEDEGLTTGDKIVIGPNEFVLYDAVGIEGGGAVLSCRVATISNLAAMMGSMTIDDVLVAEGDRVLVWQQTGLAQNGIYLVSSGAWTRDESFNSAENMVQGTLVGVSVGTVNGKSIFQFTTASEITIGSTPITFEKRNSSEWGLIGGSISAQTDLINALAEKATPKGLIDCSLNPDYPAGKLGDYYYVSVAGKIGGASGLDVAVGTRIECIVAQSAGGDEATVGSEWVMLASASHAMTSHSATNWRMFYSNGAATVAELAMAATGNALISGGASAAPSWGKIELTTHISGTLGVGNGGSGATTLTGILVGNGASAFTAIAGTANQLLRRNAGNTAYEFFTPTFGSGTVTSVGMSVPTGLSIAGSPITGAGTLALSYAAGYSIPTDANQANWTTAFGWGDHATAGYATSPHAMTSHSATNWRMFYSNGAATVAELAMAATGNALISGGASAAPSWGKIGLTTHISGTLGVGNGGSGAITLTGILVGNGASAFTAIAGTANQLLRRNAENTAYEFFSPSYITSNQTITLSGDVTGSGTTAITATIATGAVDIEMLSASGTPSASTFLRGDNTWAAIAGGGGDVYKNGTPSANQLAIWHSDGEIKGTSDLTFDASALKIGSAAKVWTYGGAKLGTNTSDGNDNLYAALCGGGEMDSDRGANIKVFGNEHFSSGQIHFSLGGASAYIKFEKSDGSEAARMTGTGLWDFQGNRLSDIGDPTSAQDAATKAYVDNLPTTFNAQTGTSYTLVLTDRQKTVTMNSASANTVTVPPNSTTAFPIGTEIHIIQKGAGKTTIAQGAGVTIYSDSGNKAIAIRYASAVLIKEATNTWYLIGALIA